MTHNDSQLKEKNPYRDLIEKAWSRCLPISAHFELTFRCNHDCVFCYNTREDEAGKSEMTLAEYRNAFQKLRELAVLFVTLTGGEPLCRKDFFEIAGAVKEEGFALRIFTNGYLIDKKVAQKIRDLRPVELEISLHGDNEETHEKVTQIKGSFRRVLAAVDNLRELGIKVNIKSLITKFNQDELERIRDLAVSRGCSITFDPMVTPKDSGETSPLQYAPDAEHLKRFWTEVFPTLRNINPAPVVEDDCNWAVCGIGRSAFAVDPYGNIFPCIMWREKIANIKEASSLKEVWENSPILKRLREMALKAKGEVLDKVEYGDFCSYCMALAKAYTGDPLKIYPQSIENAKNLALAYEMAKNRKK